MKNKILFQDIYQCIFNAIEDAGGKVFVVGGTIRDYLISHKIDEKDIDVEVYGLTTTELQEVLERFGSVNEQGKSFGILKLNEYPMIDFALPRIEKQIGVGHKQFEVEVNPTLCYKKASSRRDFTMNALMYDYHQEVILDFYQGKEDIQNKCIKMVHPDTFKEDPLRVLRLAQFLSRFQFYVDKKTEKICQEMVRNHTLDTLSDSRKYGETRKLMLGRHPSIGLVFLAHIGYITAILDDQYELIDSSKKDERYLLCLLCHFYQCDLFGIPEKVKSYYHKLMQATKQVASIDDDEKYYYFLHQLDSNILLEDVLSWLEVIQRKQEQRMLQEKIECLGRIAPNPLINGDDLIELGIVPSKYLGVLFEECYQKQLSGYSKEELVQYIKEKKR